MSSENFKAIIIEDDATFGEAVRTALEREGVPAYLSSRPEDGLAILGEHKIEFIITDCLLPQMTGVDFIMKARQLHPNLKYKVILMSGIYTDKSFVQESVRKTQAVAFLKKPFELDQLLKLVRSEEKREEVPARKALYQMFSKEKFTNRDKRKLIDQVEEVSGYDLPFIYSLLAETKSTGFLNVYGPGPTVSGISFSNGSIVAVDVEDKTTYLGELLIQNGFVTPEEVQQVLKDKTNRRLGQRLIQANLMSPHALDLMMNEQMNIRLAKTVQDVELKLNFAATEIDLQEPAIDSDLLLGCLHDWIASKIPTHWLKSLYMMWTGHVILPTASFRMDHPALRMSLVQSLEGLPEQIRRKVTLNDLLDNPEYNPVALYKAIHFLVTKGLIVFSTKAHFSTEAQQLEFLKKIETETQGLNPIEILEYIGMGNLGELSPSQAIEDYLQLMGEEPQKKNTDLHRLWVRLNKSFREAASKTSDLKSRTHYKEETAKSDAEAKLRATHLVEEAKKDLQLNQYQKAVDKLKIASKLNSQIFQFNMYMAWARLGVMDVRKDFRRLKDIELDLMQVPPDERYDSLYPFVMGLYHKAKGDLLNAKRSFDKAIAVDPSFIVARRELGLLEVQFKAKKQDIFNMDLKEVVTGFFKKR